MKLFKKAKVTSAFLGLPSMDCLVEWTGPEMALWLHKELSTYIAFVCSSLDLIISASWRNSGLCSSASAVAGTWVGDVIRISKSQILEGLLHSALFKVWLEAH